MMNQEQHDNLAKAIHAARPKIMKVAPLGARMVLGFGIFNLALAIAFFYQKTSPTISVLTQIIPLRVWAFCFFAIGVSHLVALARNNYTGVRRSLLAGMLVKSIFECTLIVQLTRGQGTWAGVLVWGFLGYLQALVYAHMAPNVEAMEQNERKVLGDE